LIDCIKYGMKYSVFHVIPALLTCLASKLLTFESFTMKKQSRSLALASKVIFAAFEILKKNSGELNGREVINQVEQRVDLDEWARSKYDKSGLITIAG